MYPRRENNNFLSFIRVGLFLAVRQVRRGSIWTNVLIVSIMMFTFLNLVVVSGILVGLIEGSVRTIRDRYTGSVIVSNLKQKEYIENSVEIIDVAESLPGVEALTARYLEAGTIEANYKRKVRPTDLDESVGVIIAGIDPEAENMVTGMSQLIVEGEYLETDDYDKVIVGAMLLKQYLDFEAQGFPTLSDVRIGSKVRVSVNGNVREVTVKGILRSKADEIDRRVFFTEKQFRGLIGRSDYNVDEISMKLLPDADPNSVKASLVASGADKYAKVQTQEEAEPKFVKDIKQTFAMLGNIISSIGLAIASITIFIVIFINAITRRKFIGILKGIGIKPKSIELAYILQSVFYSSLGTILGSAVVFGFLKPYLDRNPIDFPFSDGILVATLEGTLLRIGILFVATFIAGYIPARIVVKQNTLDAILGR